MNDAQVRTIDGAEFHRLLGDTLDRLTVSSRVLDAVGTVDQRTFEEALPDHAD